MQKIFLGCLVFLCAVLASQTVSHAEIKPEKAHSEVLADHHDKQWFWVWGNRAPSQIDGRAFLFSSEGKQLGQLNTGFWPNSLIPSEKRNELFSVETYFARGLRGERTDVVTVYDPKTLDAKREIKIPPKRINALSNTGLAVMSDDDRFLLVLNYTPAQSISIVDLDSSQFVTEVETPGCAAIYPAGARDFYSICGDGGFLHLRLDNNGKPVLRERIAPVFDAAHDFLTTSASRSGTTWYFISSDNNAYALEMTPERLKVIGKWSLVTEKERDKNWRISGVQHTAIHRASGRLYVLMHQGGPETREEPGTEAWVFDVKSHQRVDRIELKELSLGIGVTQTGKPLLYSVDFFVPMPYLAMLWVFITQGQDGIMKVLQNCITIYDVQSGKLLHKIDGLPTGYLNMVLPW